MLYIDLKHGPALSTIMMDMRKDDLVIGQIWLVPQSVHLYQVHLSEVMKDHRGNTIDFLKAAIKYGFNSIETLEKIFAVIPINNRLAIQLTK